MQPNDSARFTGLVDLASERLGGRALACSDDFFAEMQNMLKAGKPAFLPEAYTDRGKLMDGWESRRKREPGYDHCIVALGCAGRIIGFDIDTSYFLGNHPPYASVDGLMAPKGRRAIRRRDSLRKTCEYQRTTARPLSRNSLDDRRHIGDVVGDHQLAILSRHPARDDVLRSSAVEAMKRLH